ncbi:MAG: cobalamin B12-binding domain-containing protein [Methermicoccaceae archaeon]
MSKEEEIFEKLKNAIVTYDVEGGVAAAKEALEAGIDPVVAVEKGFGAGMQIISDGFDRAEIFLPQIMAAADVMKAGMDVLMSGLSQEEIDSQALGKIVICTVEGDIHDIGNNIVTALLRANRFNVIQLGRDCPIGDLAEAAKENEVDIVATSALMTTSMPQQKRVRGELADVGYEDVKFILGGAPTTPEWAEECGADGWAANAYDAVALAKKLMGL